MPRNSKLWQHSVVCQALEAHGFDKVTFSLSEELITVATSDSHFLDHLSPHLFCRKRVKPVALVGTFYAWCSSCLLAEALWVKLATFYTRALGSPIRGGVDGGDPSGGTNPGKPLCPYRLLPCLAVMADNTWNCPYMPRQGGMSLHTHVGGMSYFILMTQHPGPLPNLYFVIPKKL